MKKYRIEILLVICIAILTTLLFTLPAVFHVTGSYLGDGGDNYEYVSYSQLVAHNVSQGHFPYVFTNFWRYPVGFNFYLGSDSYLTTLTAGILTLLLGSVLAFNLTILFIMTLNGVLSFLFFRTLTHSKLLGVSGMIMYGFSFHALSKEASHANLLFNGGFTLLAFCVLQITRTLAKENNKKALRSYIILGLFSILLTAFGSTEYFFMLMFFIPIIGLIGFLLYKETFVKFFWAFRNDIKHLIVYVFSFAVLLLLFYSPHLLAVINQKIVLPNRNTYLTLLTPSISDYLLPNGYLHLLISNLIKNFSFHSIERAVFFGWAELVLFLIFLFVHFPKRVKVFLLLCFSIPFALSLGYGQDDHFFLLPYHFLSHTFPFNTVVQSGRYVVVAYFFSTIAIILLLQKIRRRVGIAVLVFFLLAFYGERLSNNTYLSSTTANKPYYAVVAKQKTSGVLDIPIDIGKRTYNLDSFFYNKPIVNGYFHYFGDGNMQKEFILQQGLIERYTCSLVDPITKNGMHEQGEQYADTQMLILLKKYNIKTIVIHKDDTYYHPVCQNVRMRVDRLLTNTQFLTPTKDEKKISNQVINGTPHFSFYFPEDGVFFIDGLTLYPADKTQIRIIQEEKPTNFSYTFAQDTTHNTWNLQPLYQVNTPVTKGSIITLVSNHPIDYAHLDLWYRYFLNGQKNATSYTPLFTKVYDGKDAAVFHIN